MEEKRIVGGTMDAVRARLAPIRGIPTKQGNLADPNQVLRRYLSRRSALVCSSVDISGNPRGRATWPIPPRVGGNTCCGC